MKIAQIAPIWTSVPPAKYGGAEKIISLLTDELVNRGHDVTLFASGDSKTKAKLSSVCHDAPGLTKDAQMNIVNNMNHFFNMFMAQEKQNDFDIIHWHLSKDIVPIMFANITKTPSIITIHNHFYEGEMKKMEPIFNHYKDFKNVVSISNYHRKYFPFNFLDTVYNGIDLDEFEFNENPSDYMVWIGRLEHPKGIDTAIKAAIELRKKLKIAAPADDNQFFREKVEPFLKNEFIEYVGEIDSQERNKLLKDAKVFINPIRWDEPFGLVVPEANACGTPVIAYERGAMKEIIKENINGKVVEKDNYESFIATIKGIYDMPDEEYKTMRVSSRRHVEENFTYQIMTRNYEKVYGKIRKRWLF